MTLLLYAATILIWGSTWYAIKFQLNGTAEEVSVGIRFIIAAVVLFAFAAARGKSVRIARPDWLMVALQGSLLFCLNYLFVYPGTNYIPSGLMAVLFTLLVPANLVNEKLFLKMSIDPRVALAGGLGMLGVALMLWPELSHTDLSSDSAKGIALGLAAVYFASLGNVAATINTRRRLSVTAVNAWGMLLGGSLSLAFAAVMGRPMTVQFDAAYGWTMLYLSVFGSAAAFTFYVMLIERIGSARAAYSSVLLPVVALLLSTVFEGFVWTVAAMAGLALTLIGNVLALGAKQQNTTKPPPTVPLTVAKPS
ncbi:MAG: EamA family transporter [Pseudomonadota bacterium]